LGGVPGNVPRRKMFYKCHILPEPAYACLTPNENCGARLKLTLSTNSLERSKKGGDGATVPVRFGSGGLPQDQAGVRGRLRGCAQGGGRG